MPYSSAPRPHRPPTAAAARASRVWWARATAAQWAHRPTAASATANAPSRPAGTLVSILANCNRQYVLARVRTHTSTASPISVSGGARAAHALGGGWQRTDGWQHQRSSSSCSSVPNTAGWTRGGRATSPPRTGGVPPSSHHLVAD